MILLLPACMIALQMTAKAPSNVEVTVYNKNFALVKETRDITFKQGRGTVAVEDVAASIDPTTVHFKTLDDPLAVDILEQDYKYDLLSPFAVMEKSIGKKVRLHRVLPDGKKEIVEGTLLSAPQSYTPPPIDYGDGSYGYGGGGYGYNAQGTIIKANDGRIILNPSGEVEVMELPEGLISKPTLFWDVVAHKAGNLRSEISYITDDVNWMADYVATINKDDTALDLTGWVTLTNNSGTTYKNAKLKLVAGDVQRTSPRRRNGYNGPMGGYGGGMGGAMGEAKPGFTEKAFFEYHLYTLRHETTIANREIKQVSLLEGNDVPAKKLMVYEGQHSFWQQWHENYRPGEGQDTDENQKVNVMIEVKNTEANHLGIPLPKGHVRVYKRDDDGQLQFIGEDTIDHTPRDEKVQLYLGNAFDVVATRKRTDYKIISFLVIEQEFEINVRNHKDSAVTVDVVEHPWSDWTVLSKSQDYEKRDAHTIDFYVTIPPNGEKTVTYRVRSVF